MSGMRRPPGLSVRLRFTLSYAALVIVAGGVLLVVVWVFLLRYVPPHAPHTPGPFAPGRNDLVRAFAPPAIWALAFLLVFGLLGGWMLAGRMLAPLTRLTEGVRAVESGELSHRVALEGRRDEFRELADAFDSMLARLERHIAEQRRFAANASHELRTPLAITRTLLDVARNDPGHDHAELIARLQGVNTRAIELTEALLLLSRAGQGAFTTEPVDLSLLAEEAGEVLLPLAEKHGVTVETAGEVAFVTGARSLLLQATMNLLHNGIVHNTPGRGHVRVDVVARDNTVTLTVENTGAVIGAHLVATLAEPFQRGAQRARTSDHAGTGLGLAIVRSIAHAHGGTLFLAPRASGGLHASVQLPGAGAGIAASRASGEF